MNNDMKELAKQEILLYRFGPIWDGNLNSKSVRDFLVDNGFIERAKGFQFLTKKGIELLVDNNLLDENTWNKRK
jgi:hypothetical protein